MNQQENNAAIRGSIDAHQHFWRYDPARHGWIDDDMKSIRRDFMPEDLQPILQDAGIKAQVTGFELMFHVGFGLEAPARSYRDLLRCDKALYVRFAHALLKRGVRILERGAWFVSFEHDDGVIDATLEAVRGAAKDIQ